MSMRPVFAAFVVASTLCTFASDAFAAGAGRSAGVTLSATAAVSPAASTDQAPSGNLSEPEQRLRDREKLLGLEEQLERQRQEHQATQQTLAAMQAKLREAEQVRRTDPTIYGLTILAVLLLGTIVVLLWRLSRLQSQRSWIEEARALAEQLSPDPVAMQRTTPLKVTPPMNEATMTSMRVLGDPSREGMDGATPPGSDPANPTTVPAAARPRRELSADELIDLEQQADFFVALGQEEAAIDLLMGHVRSSGGTSPMPYLKLLGIYRRRGEGDAYERIRERFNRRFNAQAPSWEEYGEQRRTLECYDPVFERIVAAWKTPTQAVDLIQALLYRRDASNETFELPAYEELLFLYAVARDVLEHMTNPDGVDLLLPLAVEPEESAIMHYEVTRPPDAWMQPGVDLELDLTPPRKR